MDRLGMTMVRIGWLTVSIAALALAACGKESADGPEANFGRIETMVDDVTRTLWPGNVRSDGQRYIRRLNGFFEGEPSAYYFIGFAPRRTADVFWFCRESDEACPIDKNGVVDREHTIGNPVFSKVLGDPGFSPFWLIWVVRVPDDYEPNEIKSVEGIEKASKAGRVEVERFIYDHGGDIGPEMTIMHCLLVLEGTVLEYNGEDMVNQPGVPSMFIETQKGWIRQYEVDFFDFTFSEGVFPPDGASESMPMMPSADIFVFFRDCDGGSHVDICDLNSAEHGAVSERGVEKDLTTDGDLSDTNNIISGFPFVDSAHPEDRIYSPLWRVNKVRIPPEHDDKIRLIDTSLDQNTTLFKTSTALRQSIARGHLHEPVDLSQAEAGDAIPGNDGKTFFNCPSQVPAR